MNTMLPLLIIFSLFVSSGTAQNVSSVNNASLADCIGANNNLSASGSSSFTSAYLNNGSSLLSWTLGVSIKPGSDDMVSAERYLYFGFGPDVFSRDNSSFFTCDLFVGLNATGFIAAGVELPDDCMNDLTDLVNQTAWGNSPQSEQDVYGHCAQLAQEITDNSPTSCNNYNLNLTQSQDFIGSSNITTTTPEVTTCQPTAGENYYLGLVDSDTVSTKNGSFDLENIIKSVVPIITVIYPRQQTASNLTSGPEIHILNVRAEGTQDLLNQVQGSLAFHVPAPSRIALGLMMIVPSILLGVL